MTRIRITTPSRLHFGLLGWGPDSPRQFGGVGLMIDAPGIVLSAEPSARWHAEGPRADRALEVARRAAAILSAEADPVAPATLRVHRAPAEHIGLGVGTQLSLAVARAVTGLAGLPEPSIETLAGLAGRGLRSGIGLHGFAHGGLIVDGGRRTPGGIPPLLARLAFPPEWSVLILIPERPPGLHGTEEVAAFAQLPPIPGRMTDRLCRLVLLGLLPAAVERSLGAFGDALSEIQQLIGRSFAPAQGGIFAQPELEPMVAYLTEIGLQGVGQSSWGPTLYAFSAASESDRAAMLPQIRGRFGLAHEAVFWTSASLGGASISEWTI